jgi:hypothetical protein
MDAHRAAECIQDATGGGGGTRYLVKWQGLDEASNTWEPADVLSPELVAAFEVRPDPAQHDAH